MEGVMRESSKRGCSHSYMHLQAALGNEKTHHQAMTSVVSHTYPRDT